MGIGCLCSGDKKYEANDTITDILVYLLNTLDNLTENNTDKEPASPVHNGIIFWLSNRQSNFNNINCTWCKP